MTTDLHNLTPLPGRCYVKPEMTIRDPMAGGILIPELARINRGKGGFGTVIKENPAPGSLSGLEGLRVSLQSSYGVQFTWQGVELRIVDLHVDQIIGVLYEGIWIDSVTFCGRATHMGEQGIVRCRWCKSKGKANLILLPAGYCHQCKRYPSGVKYRPPRVVEHPITGEKKVMHYEYGTETEEDLERFSVPKPKRARGMIASYPGQGRRS